MTTLPLALHYIKVSLSFTIIHLHPSSFNVIHLHPFSFTFIHLSTFIHFHPLLSNLIHFHRLPSSTLIEWLQKISIPPRPLNPHGRSLEIPRGRGVYGRLLFQRVMNLRSIWSTKTYLHALVLKQKSVLLASEMRLTSWALMFLFFFELASTTISRRMMCLWNKVKAIENSGHNWSLLPRLPA